MQPAPPLVLALPARARVVPFADGCRAAALDFVNRVSVRAGKQALADWLGGAYRSHVLAIARSRARRIEAPAVLPGALEKLLAQARTEVIGALGRLRDPAEGVGFGFGALSAGLVYRCQDADGAQGWVPVDQPRMRLADRVLSLFAADYLLRAEDYEQALFRCEACATFAFDAQARAVGGEGVCRAHGRASDIRDLVSGESSGADGARSGDADGTNAPPIALVG